jgi:hypothetical protein
MIPAPAEAARNIKTATEKTHNFFITEVSNGRLFIFTSLLISNLQLIPLITA